MKITAAKEYYCKYCGDRIIKGQKYYRNRMVETYDTKECMSAYAHEMKGIKPKTPDYA